MSPEEWRKKAGLSQEDVARLLGIAGKNPARTWQRWESGCRQPPLTIISKIEALSDGRVTTRSWITVRTAKGPAEVAASPSHDNHQPA